MNIMSFTFDLFNHLTNLIDVLWNFLTYEIPSSLIVSPIISNIPGFPETFSVLGVLSGVGVVGLIVFSIVKN